MKAVYMMLSGLVLSIIATLAMAGLISLSTLIKPTNNHLEVMKPKEDFTGLWVTEDGYIRHELLTGGRYDEAKGGKRCAYKGSYTITGNHIDYKDDTGFTADGEFKGDILHHGGHISYRHK